MKRFTVSLLILTILMNVILSVSVGASTYARPSGADIIASVNALHKSRSHPRLMITPSKLTAIQGQLTTDPQMSAWKTKVIDAGVSAADKQDPTHESYQPISLSLANAHRQAESRIPQMAFAALIDTDATRKARLKNIAINTMMSICDFAQWRLEGSTSKHYFDLETAGFATGMALGLDWLYNDMTSEQQIKVKNAIKNKALVPAYNQYTKHVANNGWCWCGLGEKDYYNNSGVNNWTAVCNSAIVLSSLVLAGESDLEVDGVNMPEFCSNKALISIENFLPLLEPDGAYMEGPEYWQYASGYFVRMWSALESSTENTNGYGRLNAIGVDKTCYFPIYMTLQESMANFGDDSAHRQYSASTDYFWYGNKFNNPDFIGYRSYLISIGKGATVNMYDMIYYNADTHTTEAPKIHDKVLKGDAQYAILNGGNSMVAFKGGKSDVNHGHHDIGSFLYDAKGIRWAMDIGPETYYDDYMGSGRFKYYRTRMEGHNTIVLNPSATDSIDNSTSEITEMKSGVHGVFTVLDMKNALGSWASSAKRGLLLNKDTDALIVQDEITSKTNGLNSWWFMHTEATITLKESGKAALLEKDGKYLYAKILEAPAGAVFTSRDATPLVNTGIKSGSDTANTGIRKLSINMSLPSSSQKITVALVPVNGASVVPSEYPEVKAISQWNVTGLPITSASGGADAIIDGDTSTSWHTNDFSQTILYMGGFKTISKVAIYWGGKSGYEFNIHASRDGKTWGYPFRAGNSSVQGGYEEFISASREIRYIRITVNGNLKGDDCDIYEVLVE